MKKVRSKIKTLIVIASGMMSVMPMTAGDYVKDAEPTVLEVRYIRHQVTDTTRRDDRFFDEETMLRIGPTKSVFCSVKYFMRDSLVVVNPTLYWQLEHAAFLQDRKGQHTLERSGRHWVFIYKNYPEGKVTEQAYFDMEDWRYEEDWEKPEWTIGNETKEILDYECFKAETDYRGRHWTAWFSPEIPLEEGPWKLCGLPGLILEAHDTNSDYSFIANGIFQNPEAEVGLFTYRDRRGIIKVTRDKYFNEWWRYKHKDIASEIKAAYTNLPVEPKKDVKPNYDKEETDYPHDLGKKR